MVAAHIVDDGFVHLVAANTNAGGISQAAQGKHRNFSRAAADIHHHRAYGLGNRHAGTDCCCHWLQDQAHLRSAGIVGSIANGATLHGRGA